MRVGTVLSVRCSRAWHYALQQFRVVWWQGVRRASRRQLGSPVPALARPCRASQPRRRRHRHSKQLRQRTRHQARLLPHRLRIGERGCSCPTSLGPEKFCRHRRHSRRHATHREPIGLRSRVTALVGRLPAAHVSNYVHTALTIVQVGVRAERRQRGVHLPLKSLVCNSHNVSAQQHSQCRKWQQS